jgi:hypothetical protein
MCLRARYLAFFLVLISSGLSAQDSLGASGRSPNHKPTWEVSCEVGEDFLSIFAEPNWQPLYSLRGGLAKTVAAGEVVSFGGQVEYHRYVIGTGAPDFITHLSNRGAKRHDVDAYLEVLFSGHYVLEFGATLVNSDPVDVIRNGQVVGPWAYGGLSRLSVHLAGGWRTDVDLSEHLALRLGAYYLLPTHGAARVFLFRTGLAIRC